MNCTNHHHLLHVTAVYCNYNKQLASQNFSYVFKLSISQNDMWQVNLCNWFFLESTHNFLDHPPSKHEVSPWSQTAVRNASNVCSTTRNYKISYSSYSQRTRINEDNSHIVSPQTKFFAHAHLAQGMQKNWSGDERRSHTVHLYRHMLVLMTSGKDRPHRTCH